MGTVRFRITGSYSYSHPQRGKGMGLEIRRQVRRRELWSLIEEGSHSQTEALVEEVLPALLQVSYILLVPRTTRPKNVQVVQPIKASFLGNRIRRQWAENDVDNPLDSGQHER